MLYTNHMNTYRLLEEKLQKHFTHYQQAIVLLGARQVGKTTLLRRLFPDAQYLLSDEKPIREKLEAYSSDVYRTLLGSAKQIILDELHLLSDPGRAVKLLYDQLPDRQIIVTGSSALHIRNKTTESMAGRAFHYYLYPLTWGEYLFQHQIEPSPNLFISQKILKGITAPNVTLYDQRAILERVLLYGQYPEMVNQPPNTRYLKNLAAKAVFQDILELNLIDNRAKAVELLKLLAYQIGNLISYAELSNRLGISAPTVQRYIEILEQSFILYRIYPYSRNHRDEIGKAPKIYFWDLGLRNALINNFDNLAVRPDAGALFENFIITEVKKEISYLDLEHQVHYWRLKSGAEVDLILSTDDNLLGCEIKLTAGKVSSAFTNRYPEAQTHLLTAENFC